MSTAQVFKDYILENRSELSLKSALLKARTHPDLWDVDRTYADYENYSDIFIFNDGSQLKIGNDGSIFLDADEEIEYLTLEEI